MRKILASLLVFLLTSIVSFSAPSINPRDIKPGTVDTTEFGYLDGVTNSIQTQLNFLSSNNTASVWVQANSNLISSMYTRTSSWNQAVIDSASWTNWYQANSGSWASVLSRTSSWNNAYSTSIIVSNWVVATSNLAQNAYDTSIFSSNNVVGLSNLVYALPTNNWNQSYIISQWSSNNTLGLSNLVYALPTNNWNIAYDTAIFSSNNMLTNLVVSYGTNNSYAKTNFIGYLAISTNYGTGSGSGGTNTISEVLTKGNDMAGLGMTNGFANLTRLSLRTNVIVTSGDGANVGIEVLAAPVAGQSSSVWMGQYALASASGSGNVMLGWAAGYQGSGDTSVGIGYQALYQCNGNDNVGIGNGALARVTGSQNTAIGAGAGINSNAYRSTFIGAAAAQGIGGTLNVGVGYEALKESTGSGNTALNSAMQASPSTNSVAIGSGAGSLSPGLENVSIGYVSGNTSTGSYNSSIGPGSRWNSAGSYNNAFGLHALADCYGSYNVAFGSESLRYGTGNYNVAIGEFAGEHTGGTNNLFLGAYSGNSATYTVYTDATTIGANVKPKGSSTVAIGLSNQTTYVDGALMVQNTNIGQQVATVYGWGNHATSGYALASQKINAATNSDLLGGYTADQLRSVASTYYVWGSVTGEYTNIASKMATISSSSSMGVWTSTVSGATVTNGLFLGYASIKRSESPAYIDTGIGTAHLSIERDGNASERKMQVYAAIYESNQTTLVSSTVGDEVVVPNSKAHLDFDFSFTNMSLIIANSNRYIVVYFRLTSGWGVAGGETIKVYSQDGELTYITFATAADLGVRGAVAVQTAGGASGTYDIPNRVLTLPSALITNGATASLNGTGVTNLPVNSGFENITSSTMNFNNATRTFTLYAVSPIRYTTMNQYWWSLATNISQQIADIEGLHYIYFRPSDGVVTNSTVSWTIAAGEAQIAMIYWDKINQKCLYLGDERHGKDITDTEHVESHFVDGAKWYSGGTLIYNITSGVPSTSGSNTVVSIQSCSMWDDDHTNTTAGLGNQTTISYTNSGAQFNIMYATGLVASVAWRTNGVSNFPFLLSPDGSAPVYNLLTTGVWGTNVVPEDNYFISWIVQVPAYQDGTNSGFVLIPDSAVSTTVTGAQARTYNKILENRSVNITSEMKPLYRLILLRNASGGGSYSPLVKSTKLVEVQDLRLGNQNPAIGISGSQADLSVFLRRDGGDAGMAADLNFGTYDGTNMRNLIISGVITQSLVAGTNYFAGGMNVGPLTVRGNHDAQNNQITNAANMQAITGTFNNIYLNGVGITTNLDVILNDNTNNQVLVTVVSGSNTNLIWTNSPTFKSLTVNDGINLGGTSLSTNLASITNNATDGTYLYASVSGGVTNYSWQPLPQTSVPWPIVSATSSDVSQVWTYQKLTVTNSPCTLYFQGVSVLGSNVGRTLWLTVDKGSNSFSFANANCTTVGVGCVTNLVATNSGVSDFMFVLPCAGTNLNVVWKGYPL